MTHTLLLSLRGPMQSWGSDSHFPVRRTGHAPTKSGVIGMVASALGRERAADLEDLAALEFAVRIEHRGTLVQDFQTAIQWTTGRAMPLSTRQYLCDAHFTAAIGGDRDQLEEVDRALKNPRWPLFLGRRSCPPMGPVSMGIREGSPREVLTSLEPQVSEVLGRGLRKERTLSLEVYADASPEAAVFDQVRDRPVSFSQTRRRYLDRRVERFVVGPFDNPYYREPRKASSAAPGEAGGGESSGAEALTLETVEHDPMALFAEETS